jgi:hypothetical protein
MDGQGRHQLPPTPLHRGTRSIQSNLRPRHHVYIVDYYSRVVQGDPIFIRGPLLEYMSQKLTIPQMNENESIT